MKFIKKFEGFSDIKIDENQNFYEIVGSNLPNLILDQQNQISRTYKKNINSRLLNSITGAGIKLSNSEILKILHKDLQQRLRRINSKKITVDQINKEFEAYFYFLQYLIVNLHINIQELLKNEPEEVQIKRGTESYRVFDLANINKTAKNIKALWLKLLSVSKVDIKNVYKLKLAVSTYLVNQNQRWTEFFKDDWKEYQIKKLPQTIVDEQQKEKEDIIQKEEGILHKTFTKTKDIINLGKSAITKVAAGTKVVAGTKAAITTLPIATAIMSPVLISRFDQKHGVNKGANKMKTWFLQMIRKAERSYGKTFQINSGYRSSNYQKQLRLNPKIKAAKNSPHVAGIAADINIKGENKQKIIDSLTKAGFNRLGIGKNFIHVDAGDKVNSKTWPPYARWGYGY